MALNGWGSSWLYSQIHQEQLFQLLKWNSHLLKKLFYLLQWKLFKNYEKCFLFDLMFCYWFTSHHGIITRPHLHSCYTINFNDHILSYLFQTKVHLIHFTYQSPSYWYLPYLVTLIAFSLTLIVTSNFNSLISWNYSSLEAELFCLALLPVLC